jgi:hypothetical protein
MSQPKVNRRLRTAALLAGISMFVFTEPAWAIFGRWAVAAVAVSATRAHDEAAVSAANNAAAQQAAANANAQQSAQAAEAAARQSAYAAQEAAARTAAAPAPPKTAQQKLAELQSLYDQKLISQSDYQAAKTKILNSMVN